MKKKTGLTEKSVATKNMPITIDLIISFSIITFNASVFGSSNTSFILIISANKIHLSTTGKDKKKSLEKIPRISV